MFAIIEDGGRQYKVSPGQQLAIDLRQDAEADADIVFDKVLLANGGGASLVGLPTISGATVSAKVDEPLYKGVKLEIGKFRRRKTFRKHTGHRQKYTVVTVGEFHIPGLEIVETAQVVPAETAPVESAPVETATAEE